MKYEDQQRTTFPYVGYFEFIKKISLFSIIKIYGLDTKMKINIYYRSLWPLKYFIFSLFHSLGLSLIKFISTKIFNILKFSFENHW